MKKFIFLLCFGLFSQTPFALRPFYGNWNTFIFTSDQNKKFFYFFQLEPRIYADSSNTDQILISPSVGYTVNQWLSLWVGDDYIPFLYVPANNTNEIWEQAELKIIHSARFNFVSRTRMGERHSFKIDGSALRLRQRFLLNLNNAITDKISPQFYNEFFINFNHPAWVSNKTLSQNRAFGGIEIQYNKIMLLVIGYLNRTDFNSTDTNIDHLLNLTFQVIVD